MSAGTVMWFTGLPASGKTTLAAAVRAVLCARRLAVVLLDSDEVRSELFPTLGYGVGDRDRFYAALGRLAALLARQGLTVLVAATANRRAYRSAARRAAPRFVEVFVDTPADECARRDPKGLYKRGGRRLPGRGAAYEVPRRPDVRARGGLSREAVDACLEALRGYH